MSANAKDTGPVLSGMDDDLPDFSGDDWAAKIDAAPVKRGRPKVEGAGWQSRMNEALRKAAGLG